MTGSSRARTETAAAGTAAAGTAGAEAGTAGAEAGTAGAGTAGAEAGTAGAGTAGAGTAATETLGTGAETTAAETIGAGAGAGTTGAETLGAGAGAGAGTTGAGTTGAETLGAGAGAGAGTTGAETLGAGAGAETLGVGAETAGAARTGGRSRRLGASMMLLSGVGFGMSGVFTRSIEAGAWQIASWRAVVGSVGVAVYMVWRRRSNDKPARPRIGPRRVSGVAVDHSRRSNDKPARTRLGPAGGRQFLVIVQVLVLVSLGAASMLLIIVSLQKTAVANVSVIVATFPFMAAGLAWLLLRERLRRSTVIASVVSFGGVLLTVTGSLGGGDLEGDLYAVALALSLAALMVLIRRFGGADALLAQVGAGIALFAVALTVADPLGIDRGQLPLTVAFGSVFAAAVILWTEGVRLIPAAEAGLLGTSETPCSILFAWILVSEAPPLATVAGGLLIVGAVLVHARADLVHGRVSRPWLRPRARPRI